MKKILKLIFCFFILITMNVHAQKGKEILYVGTYSDRGSEGIYVFEFDRAKGSLTPVQTIVDKKSPIFVEVHPSGKYLYSTNVGGTEEKPDLGSFSSFTIDNKTGKLTFLNNTSSLGAEPCHITIDEKGKWAFVSNYGGGNVAVFPIEKSGKISASSDLKQFSGSSVNKDRQEASHIHSAILSPDQKYLYVSDLGTDKIEIFEVDAAKGLLTPAQKPEIAVNPGSGPRHFVFHPNGKYAYGSEELSSSVCSFSFNKATGALEIIKDNIVAIPEDYSGENYPADIDTDPAGKFLFMSNRGLNSVATFSIDNDGSLKLLGNESTQGDWPRGFLVDKKGEFLFVANQKSDDISVFKLDQKTGRLTFTGTQVKVPSPVCLKMLHLK
ncbi:MAG TPA: lactonase family protein [Cytophagales bacterium]|nr:lactonase family protein [Cytophagales bacterium]